jgi:hypothetical protein
MSNQPLWTPREESQASRTLLPNDHVKMLVELLQPTGPELARRWVSLLLQVPRAERAAMVDAVARRVAEVYGLSAAAAEVGALGAEKGAPKRSPAAKRSGAAGRGSDADVKPARTAGQRASAGEQAGRAEPPALEVVYPPKAGPGYVEQVRVRYERSEHEPTTAKRVERKRG